MAQQAQTNQSMLAAQKIRLDNKKQFASIAESFLINYGNLATQLRDEESLVISLGASTNFPFQKIFYPLYATTQDYPQPEEQVLIANMGDIRAFHNGSISELELKNRIQREIKSPTKDIAFKVFGKIMQDKIKNIEEEVTNAVLLQLGEEEVEFYNLDAELFYLSAMGKKEKMNYSYLPRIGYAYEFSLEIPNEDRTVVVKYPSGLTISSKKDLKTLLKSLSEKDNYAIWLAELKNRSKGCNSKLDGSIWPHPSAIGR